MVTKINSNFLKAYVRLGNSYTRLNDLDNAIQNYNRVLYYFNNTESKNKYREFGLNPSDLTETYFGLGSNYFEKNKIDDAIHYYNQGLKIDSNYASLYGGLGFAFQEKKDTNTLINFNKAIQKDSSLWGFYYNIGDIYFNMRKYQLAIDNYVNYLHHDSVNTGKKSNLVEIRDSTFN